MSGTERRGLRFRPRARLMNTLGRELISSETVALSELVKNAYDADAGFVLVRITGDLDADGAIVAATGSISVLDDGHGMGENRIIDTWLEPATSFRRERCARSGQRRVLGEKGIGRFAAAKLGDRMDLTSKADGCEEVHLGIDWQDFNNDSKYLQDIELDLDVGTTGAFAVGGTVEHAWRAQPNISSDASNLPTTGHGTLIKVTGLHNRWTSEQVKDVHRSLSMLVSPFAEERGIASNFKICLDVPDGTGTRGGVVTSADLLKRHHYSLSAEIEASGTATVLLTLKDGRELEREFTVSHCDDGAELKCGPFEIFLHVWDRDSESMSSLANVYGSRKLAKDTLDSASGVSIYRDGFRVLPYGETGDDWLSLDARRVQNPTLRLSNNQIVGYILIGRETNPELIDQSSREGLVETPAFRDLRKTVIELLSILESERYKSRHDPRSRQQKKTTGRLFHSIDLKPLRAAVLDAVPDDLRIHGMLDAAQRDFDNHFKHVGEVLSRYHRLATLGKLIDMVVHELTQPVFAIKQAASLGIQTLEDVPGTILASLDGVSDEVSNSFNRIKDQADVLNTVINRIEPFGGRRRGRPTRYILEEIVHTAVDLLAPRISAVGVSVGLPLTRHEVTLDKAEIQEVIINLMDNSLFWLAKSKKHHKKIEISIMKHANGSLAITLEDSGPGIPEEYRELIFEPYFTTKPDGVGLGLAIAGEIVEDYYGGSLELLPPDLLGGARFRATLRKRVT